MRWRYDEDLVEGVVNLYSSRPRRNIPALQVKRCQIERERLYLISDPDERNSAFFKWSMKWFCEWGAEEKLKQPIGEFSILPRHLSLLAFRKARNKTEEGAEMFVHSNGEKNGVIALQPEMFEQDDRLERLLRHELTHLHDMLDPLFAYSPEIFLPSQRGAQYRLTLMRYRLLWDVTIDGRILNSGRPLLGARDQRWNEFNRAYSFWTESRRKEVFETLWNDPQPRHEKILSIAADPRDLKLQNGTFPGSSCPLCTFPTFEWMDGNSMGTKTIAAILSQFPRWSPDQGACKRCVEIYESTRLEQPATLCV